MKAALADAPAWDGPDVAGKTVVELAQIVRDGGKVLGLGRLGKRWGVHVDGPVAAGIVKAAFVSLGEGADELAEALASKLKIVDVESLAKGTALEASDLLYAKDSKAWVDGDLVRLLVTWVYGGVWVDMDSLLTRDLSPLLEHEFVTQWDCYGTFHIVTFIGAYTDPHLQTKYTNL